MDTSDLIRYLKSDLKPVKPLRSPASRLGRYLLAAALCLVSGVAVTGPRHDLLLRATEPRFWAVGTLILLTSVLAAASAFTLSVPGRERGHLARSLPLISLGALIALLGALYVQSPSHRIGVSLVCLGDISLVGVLPSAILFWMIRAAAPLRLDWTGAFIAISVTALGALGAQLSCHSDDAGHLLLWHIAPVIALGIIGISLGKLLLRRRRC